MSELMWSKGRAMRVVHQDELSRDEKDALRVDEGVMQHGKLFLLEIDEEPEVEPTTAPEDEQEEGDEPTLADLEALTVPALKDLADKEEVDVSDLKLKADLVGRLAAHFGVNV
jgi:hypothetical protein